MRLLRGEPGSVFVRCCGFPVLCRTRGGRGAHTRRKEGPREKTIAQLGIGDGAFGIVVVGVTENIRFL